MEKKNSLKYKLKGRKRFWEAGRVGKKANGPRGAGAGGRTDCWKCQVTGRNCCNCSGRVFPQSEKEVAWPACKNIHLLARFYRLSFSPLLFCLPLFPICTHTRAQRPRPHFQAIFGRKSAPASGNHWLMAGLASRPGDMVLIRCQIVNLSNLFLPTPALDVFAIVVFC